MNKAQQLLAETADGKSVTLKKVTATHYVSTDGEWDVIQQAPLGLPDTWLARNKKDSKKSFVAEFLRDIKHKLKGMKGRS